MGFKLVHITSAVLALAGTWLLAFGLRIIEGIEPKLRKKLRSSLEDKIVCSDVTQRPVLFWIGLGLITLGALIELGAIILA